MNGRFYSPKECAALLGISKGLMYRLLRSGELPVVAVTPRCLRVRAEDIEAFLTERTQSPDNW